jgi:ribonuclease P protein component
MKKVNILKENRFFEKIITNNKPYRSSNFIVYKVPNNDVYKFGISIPKKTGNAVVRNKLKRQIKDIIDKNVYENNFICIIIVKKSSINFSYNDLKQELNGIFFKLKIFKEEQNEQKD